MYKEECRYIVEIKDGILLQMISKDLIGLGLDRDPSCNHKTVLVYRIIK